MWLSFMDLDLCHRQSAFWGAIWECIMSNSINESIYQPYTYIPIAICNMWFKAVYDYLLTPVLTDLGLAQILPMYDDDTGAEPNIISASFADPFLLLLRDDASIFVARCDDNNELEEVEKEDQSLLSTKWVTGCLYSDSTGVFASDKEQKDSSQNCLMFLLSATGALHVGLFGQENEARS
jgi:hypothetical protein